MSVMGRGPAVVRWWKVLVEKKHSGEKSYCCLFVCLFVYFHDLLQALFEDPFENTRVEKYLINVIVVTLYPLIQPF